MTGMSDLASSAHRRLGLHLSDDSAHTERPRSARPAHLKRPGAGLGCGTRSIAVSE